MRVFGALMYGAGFLMSPTYLLSTRPQATRPIAPIAIQPYNVRQAKAAISVKSRVKQALLPQPGVLVLSRHAAERSTSLLPSRGGVDRLRAYSAYLVAATRDCRHHLSPDRAERIARAILLSADREGLDPRLFTAMIQRESDFNPDEISSCGAKGLGQLTHWDDGGVDCYNIEANLTQSAKNLKGHLKEFGSPELALAAYNAGEEAVRKHHGIPPYTETRAHVRVVMSIYRRISRE